MPATILVGDREIGPGRPCYVIAEAGVNHNGDQTIAERLVDAAVAAGADAVKFQTFSADRLAARSAAKAAYQEKTAGDETQFEMLKALELSPAAHRHLIAYARTRHIEFLSTPFDRQSAALLAELGVAAFKIGSGDVTDRFLLAHVAAYGRPVLLSTGGSTFDDVRAALSVLQGAGDPPVALLHCVSLYPTPIEDANVRAIDDLRRVFGVPVGFSDHTEGRLAPVLAVALGACILEKHLTLDRSMAGPDHALSLDPGDFRAMVHDVRQAERALGSGRKEPHAAELPIMAVVRKSLFASRRIESGLVISEDDLVALRPSGGISPMDAPNVIGRIATRPIEAGSMLSLDMIGESRKPA